MIFIPIYAAVVYRQRGRGWAGLLVSGFAIVPGLWLCIMVPHLAAACVLGLAGLAVCLVCCAGDWYGLGGKKSFAVVLGVTAGSLVVTFLLVLLLMPGLAGSLQRHLEVLLAPDANAAGAGYWMNALRRMWDGMRWLGPGDGSLPLGEKAALGTVGEFAGKAVRELRADYLLAYAGWRYGIACAAALAAAVAGALAWLWRTALRTRSGIGRLCAVGCCALLTMHGVLNLLSCLGWSSARGMLPFLDGGWTGVMQAGLAGLLLSAFRLDDVLREPQGTCAPKAPGPPGSRRPLCVQRRHAAHPASVNGVFRAVPGPQPSDKLFYCGEIKKNRMAFAMGFLQQFFQVFTNTGENLNGFFHAQLAGVDGHVVAVGRAPVVVRVEVVVIGALTVRLFDEGPRGVFFYIAHAGDALDAQLHRGVDEHRKHVLAPAQDIIRTTADDDARILFSHIADGIALEQEQLVVGEVIVVIGESWPVRAYPWTGVQKAVGGLFVRLFKQLFYDAALLGRLFQDLFVVEPDAQLFGQAQPNLAPAAAELPADANDQMLLHKSTASP